jgi:hypothetical protein
MFILVSQDKWFYTGRADAGWISEDKNQAFEYGGKGEAERKAEIFNRNTILHSRHFIVQEV